MDFLKTEKHVVRCPHCGKDVLDHMTECPFCKGALNPAGYREMDPDKRRRIKIVSNVVGLLLAAAVLIWIYVGR